MSTIKADGVEAATGTNTDLSLAGKGTGVPDLAAGFKVGSVAGVPTASIRDDAVTLAKLAAGTDGELITWDASGDPAAVAVGTATHILTSNGAGAAPTFQAAAGGGLTVATEQATTSGSTKDFTGIPSGTTQITISFAGVSTSNTDSYGVQLGDSGGFETSGYSQQVMRTFDGAANFGNAGSSQFEIFNPSASGDIIYGAMTLTLEDSSNNTWSCTGSATDASLKACYNSGIKSLSAELTQIRIITGGTFDAGAVNIAYQ